MNPAATGSNQAGLGLAEVVSGCMAEIDYAFLAEYARVDPASGTLTAVGASWTYVQSSEFPSAHRMSVAGRIRSTMAEGDVSLRISITAPGGTFSITAESILTPNPASRPYADGRVGLIFALDVQVPLPGPGLYEVVVTLPESEAQRVLRFEAEAIPSQG